MTRRNPILAASLAVALALAPFAASSDVSSGAQGAPDDASHLDALRGAADALRDSLSGLSGQAPGEWRDRAIDDTTEALHATNNAIIALDRADRAREDPSKEQPASPQGESGAQPRSVASVPARGDAVHAVPQGEGEYALLVVPAGDRLDAEVADGCWARVYTDTNFRGKALTFVGNVEVPSVDSTAMQPGRYESVIVGPGAALVAGNPQQTLTINPDQRIANLGATQPANMLQPFRSVRLACVG